MRGTRADGLDHKVNVVRTFCGQCLYLSTLDARPGLYIIVGHGAIFQFPNGVELVGR